MPATGMRGTKASDQLVQVTINVVGARRRKRAYCVPIQFTKVSATRMTRINRNTSLGILTERCVLCAAALLLTGSVFAGEDATNFAAAIQNQPIAAASVETRDDHSGDIALDKSDAGKPPRLEVGMSLEDAIKLVGTSPDSENEVGGACGMLDILTWDEDGTKIISVDGTVTSIVEGKKK